MSRRSGEGNIFVGRLNKNTRTRDLEDIFESYGRMIRCDIKYGVDSAKMGGGGRGNHESRDTTYAFIDFEDRKDAEDAIKYENGREICGNSIVVEWAKGSQRRSTTVSTQLGYDECYKCHRVGHWARDCPEDWQGGGGGGGGGGGYRGGGRGRSRSPRRRRSNRSRSREHRRSRSHSRERPRRSRSHSKSPRRRRSHSASPARAATNRSRSRSCTRSRTGSPAANGKN